MNTLIYSSVKILGSSHQDKGGSGKHRLALITHQL